MSESRDNEQEDTSQRVATIAERNQGITARH